MGPASKQEDLQDDRSARPFWLPTANRETREQALEIRKVVLQRQTPLKSFFIVSVGGSIEELRKSGCLSRYMPHYLHHVVLRAIVRPCQLWELSCHRLTTPVFS
mgnify:CR=1 FL=1